MTKQLSIGPGLSSRETAWGFGFLAVQLLALPPLLQWCNARAGHALSDPELNFLYYFINFMAVLVIFHDFLGHCGAQAIRRPILLCQTVILGLAAYYGGMLCVELFIAAAAPAHANYNNEAMTNLGRSSPFLIAVGTVVLVPPVEELLHRGLVFRNLYPRSRLAAYALSTALFAAIHILGYVGLYSPVNLCLAALQYVPAGLALAWSYAKSGTIFAPILIHAAVNAITLNLIL